MPIGMLSNDEWSFTSFSASCVKCGRSSKPGDVFYSGLSRQKQTAEETSSEETSSDNGKQNQDANTDANEPKVEAEEGNESSNEEEGVAFQRIDYCSTCWTQITPNFFSYWRTEVPEPEEEDDQEPDRSTLAGLWRGLIKQTGGNTANEEDKKPISPDSDLEHGLLYLLTLMLMRKGYLSLEQESKGEQTVLEVRVKGTDDDRYQLIEPELDSEQIESVRDELADLLDMEESEG